MAVIRPFRATRANSDIVSLVSSRSFESYSDTELDAILKSNPSSFLHIINAANKIDKNSPPEARFELIKKKFLEFKEKELFQKDENPSFYIYKKT